MSPTQDTADTKGLGHGEDACKALLELTLIRDETYQEVLEDLVPSPPGCPVHRGELNEVTRGQGGPGRCEEVHHGQAALSQAAQLLTRLE